MRKSMQRASASTAPWPRTTLALRGTLARPETAPLWPRLARRPRFEELARPPQAGPHGPAPAAAQAHAADAGALLGETRTGRASIEAATRAAVCSASCCTPGRRTRIEGEAASRRTVPVSAKKVERSLRQCATRQSNQRQPGSGKGQPLPPAIQRHSAADETRHATATRSQGAKRQSECDRAQHSHRPASRDRTRATPCVPPHASVSSHELRRSARNYGSAITGSRLRTQHAG